jgi:hypothetical protein
MPSQNLGTPETYINPQRGTDFAEMDAGWAQTLQQGVHFYPGVINPQLNEFALHGTWDLSSQSATPRSAGAYIIGGFQAQHVYLVMTSAGNRPRTVHVLLDGRPIAAADAGADVHHGAVTVRAQRLYSLVSLPEDQQDTVTVEVPPGVSAYDFTFG